MVPPLETLLTPEMTRLLVTLIIPFMIFFTVLLFAFRKTHIFGNNSIAYVTIALGLTAMIYAVNPGNVFQFLVSYLFKIGVAGSVIALLGVVAVVFAAILKTGFKFAGNFKTEEEKLKDLKKQEEKLLQKYNSRGIFGGSNVEQRMQIEREIESIDKQRRFIMAKLRKHV